MHGPLSRTYRGFRAAPALPGFNGNHSHLKKAAAHREERDVRAAVPRSSSGRRAERRGAGLHRGRERFPRGLGSRRVLRASSASVLIAPPCRQRWRRAVQTPSLFRSSIFFQREKKVTMLQVKDFIDGCELVFCLSKLPAAHVPLHVTAGAAEGLLAGPGAERHGSAAPPAAARGSARAAGREAP